MHSVAFQLASTSTRIDRFSAVAIFIFHSGSFLFSSARHIRGKTKRSHFSGSKSRSVLFRTSYPFSRCPTPLPFPSPSRRRTFRSQAESPFFSVYLKRPRCPLQIATTWNGPYRSMLYGAITSFAVPWPDSEPAASREL